MKLRKVLALSQMALILGGLMLFAARSTAFAASYTSAGTSYTVGMGVDDYTDLSSLATYTGKGPGGQYAGQGISAFAPVGGTGCFLDPSQQAGCPIDGRADGCLYEAVGGASQNTYEGPFDIETFVRVPGMASTVCIDFSTGAPPYNTVGTVVDQRTGGTGRFAGKKGTVTTLVHGQMMTMDSKGYGFSWYRGVGN
jgi:hypothetical protein